MPPADTTKTDHPPPRSYGRRRGRKLRLGRQALLEQLAAYRLEVADIRRTGLSALPEAASGRPVWLEIGFGGGEHAAWQAHQHTGIDLIACDLFEGGIASLVGQVIEKGLGNLRIVVDDARFLLDALPAASIARAFVLFPDPWPKLRHRKRRLLSGSTLAALARALVDDAELRLATDDPDYLRALLSSACAHPDFEWLARRPADWACRPADWPQTRYEAKALEAGRRPTFLRLRRRARSDAPATPV